MKPAIDAMEVTPETEHSFPEPFGSTLGSYEGRGLGDYFGLSQFGAALEVLQPNSQSALRHWHTMSDELVLVLDGKLTLITDDGETELRPGMCAGFKAGVTNAHHLINRSKAAAKFLVIGTRVRGDKVHYPDDDLQWIVEKDGSWYAARKDGTKY
jgi:uncharacterized cupin superfamily protein